MCKKPRHSATLATKLTLVAVDIISLAAAYVLSYEIRNRLFAWRAAELEPSHRHAYLLTGFVVLLILHFRQSSLYQRPAFSRSPEHLERLTQAWLVFSAAFIAIAFFFQVRLFIHYRITVLLLITLGWLFLYIGRFVVAPSVIRHFYRRWDWSHRIAVVGERLAALRLQEYLGLCRESNDIMVGRLGNEEKDQKGSVCKRLGSIDALPKILEEHRIDEVFIHLEEHDWHAIARAIEEARDAGVMVRVAIPHFGVVREKIRGLPQVEHGYVYLQRSYFHPIENPVKSVLDRCLAMGLLLVLSPLFLLLALWIKLESRGPVFFRQLRVGLDGRSFRVFKFRSMRANTEEHHRSSIARLVSGEAANPANGLNKCTDACQVTRSGRILRKTSMDELPQLINVLCGEMRLVGPRPLPTYEVELLESWQQLRHAVRPGITGFWQAYGRSTVAHRDMVLMDIFYVVSWSLAMDFRILLRTVFVVLSGRGAV